MPTAAPRSWGCLLPFAWHATPAIKSLCRVGAVFSSHLEAPLIPCGPLKVLYQSCGGEGTSAEVWFLSLFPATELSFLLVQGGMELLRAALGFYGWGNAASAPASRAGCSDRFYLSLLLLLLFQQPGLPQRQDLQPLKPCTDGKPSFELNWALLRGRCAAALFFFKDKPCVIRKTALTNNYRTWPSRNHLSLQPQIHVREQHTRHTFAHTSPQRARNAACGFPRLFSQPYSGFLW